MNEQFFESFAEKIIQETDELLCFRDCSAEHSGLIKIKAAIIANLREQFGSK